MRTTWLKLSIKRRIQNLIPPPSKGYEPDRGDTLIHECVHVYGCCEVVPGTAEETFGGCDCGYVCVGGLDGWIIVNVINEEEGERNVRE